MTGAPGPGPTPDSGTHVPGPRPDSRPHAEQPEQIREQSAVGVSDGGPTPLAGGLTLLGSPDAVACEGDSCAVRP